MTPTPPPLSAPPQPYPGAAAAAVPPRQYSLRAVAVILLLGAVLLAGVVAWGLSALVGATGWVAPLAAAAGVLVAALGLGGLAYRLGHPVEHGAAPAPALALTATGTTRELFMELAEREWARSRRYGTGAALLLIDIDRHARLLESRGTAASDAVLTELLRQTAPTLRGADVLTRYSDAQMAVFLAPADATGALDVAERVRERAEQLEVPFHPQRLRVTVSVGVAHLRPAHLNLRSLIDDAEDAVLAAHQAGGNCVRAAPVEVSRLRSPGSWRDDRRAQPK
jgi:diguanylate cyclase (GGDEF)-like protein